MKNGLAKTGQLFLIGGLSTGVFFALLWFNNSPAQAAVGINETINFQGRLLNAQGATVPDGFYNIQFKIYQDGDGQSAGNPSGTLEWTESHLNNNSQGIKVTNGYMSVRLGSVTAFGSNVDWNQSVLWLSINIGNTNPTCTPFSNCSPDGEMLPMQPLTAAPYAFNSKQLGGLSSAQFVQLAQGVQTDNTTASSIFINKTGNGNVVQLQSNGVDILSASTASNTVNIGVTGSTNASSTIHIADSSAGVQTVTIGSTNSTSATTIQAGSGGVALNGNVSISGSNTFSTGTGAVTLNGDTTIAANKTFTQSGSGTFSTGTGANSLNGDVSIATGKTFTQNGGGTFTTGTGTVSLNGNTTNINSATVATDQSAVTLFNTNATNVTAFGAGTTISLGATTGTITLKNANTTLGNAAGSGLLTNNGATLNSTLALNNFSSGGSIGSAASTVDIYTSISVNQTTASQTLTIPSPTASTNYGRLLYLSNIGSASFTLGSATISAGTTATLVWSNSNGGASWQFAGADASSVLNQNSTDQTANFRISGTGRANTSFTSPLVDSITGGLSLGTSTATGLTIGGTTNTTSIVLQGAASATYTLGTSNNTGGITVGNSTASNTIAIGSSAGNGNTQTINIGTSSTAGSTTNVNIGSSIAGTVTLSSNTAVASGKSFTANGDAVFKNANNSVSAFQVQNASGANILVVDSSSRRVRIYENNGSTNYALIYYDTSTTTANYTANTGTVAVGTGAGSISVVAGSGAAITITGNAASTWRTTAGTLTLQSGTSSDLILNPGSSIVSVNGSSVVKLGSSAGDPGTCTTGGIVYNSTTNLFRGCQNGSWATLSSTTQTLQQGYTASTGGTTPEVKLDSTRTSLDIQDADSTLNGVLFAVRGANAGGLGTSILNVNSSTSTVNIGTVANTTSLLVLGVDTNSTFNVGTVSSAAAEIDGAMFYSSTDHNFLCGTGGQWITCNGLLYSNTAASSAINTCTNACAAFNTNNSTTVPANYCTPGRVIRISARGHYSVAAATTPTLQMGVYYGTNSTTRGSNTQIGASTPAPASASGASNQFWALDYTITCFDSTSMMGEGIYTFQNNTTATTSMLVLNVLSTSATSVSTTTAKALYLFPTWSASSASNTVTLDQLVITGN